MKLAMILTSQNAETNWNALRLANLAIAKGDEVGVFLLGEGVEYNKNSDKQFNIKEQVDKFLQSKQAKLIACETCMNIRHQKSSQACPAAGMEDLYSLTKDSDKVLSF